MKTTKRYFGPAQLANAAATLFTVAAGTKATIRHIHVQNPSGAPVNLTISIGADAAGTRIYDAFPLPAQASGSRTNILDDYGPYTLTAGEILQAFASAAATLVIVIDGDEYTLG